MFSRLIYLNLSPSVDYESNRSSTTMPVAFLTVRWGRLGTSLLSFRLHHGMRRFSGELCFSALLSSHISRPPCRHAPCDLCSSMRYLPVYIDLNQQKQLIDMVQSDPDRPPGIIG